MSNVWMAVLFLLIGSVAIIVSTLLAQRSTGTFVPSVTASIPDTTITVTTTALDNMVVYDTFESASGSGQVALTGRASTLGPVWQLLDKGGLNPYQSMTLDIPGRFITSTLLMQSVANELPTAHYDSSADTVHGEVGIQWDAAGYVGTVLVYWALLDAAGDGVGYMFYYSSLGSQYVIYIINVTACVPDVMTPLAQAVASGSPFPTYPTPNQLIFTCPPDGLATFELRITGGSTLGPITAGSAPLHPPSGSPITRFAMAIDDSGNSTSFPQITGITVTRV